MVDERVIDVDAHFGEPPEAWSHYLESRYHAAMPRWVKDNQGRERLCLGGKLLPYIPAPPKPLLREIRGAFEPVARVADMDRAGIDVMVIYPTTGLYFFSIEDPSLCTALCRAYNNWARDYCAHDARRLMAPAIVPQHDVGDAVTEARRGLEQLGLCGVFMRPNPIGGRTLDHPAFEPLWALLEERNAPLVLHEGTTQDVPQAGNDRYDNFMFRHMLSHPFEQQMALLSLICGGVLERHPGLKVLIVECGVGWLPYWIDRMDDHITHWGHASVPLRCKPSEYFARQCWVAADGDERLLPFTIAALGDDNVCFSSDYPHPDHDFAGVVDGIKRMPGLSESSKRKILSTNASRLFGLEVAI